MKTLRHLIVCLAMAVGSIMISTPASAQTGNMTLGVAGGLATYNNGGYVDLFFQYQLANHFRLAPEIGYVFRNEGKSAFEMAVDLQFPFKIAKGFGVYPLVGFTYNNWSYQGGGHASRAGADFGAGFDFNLTSNLKLSLQGKYSAMNDTGGGFFNMGIGYVF